jgi:imidazolonepropionase
METVNRTCQTTQNELFSVALERVDTALRSGTTTLEIKSGYGLRLYDELKILRVIRRLQQRSPCSIVPTFLGAHSIPPGQTVEAYSRNLVEEMIPAVQRENLAEFCDVFCEREVFDPDSSEMILRAGARAGLRPKIHADQLTDSSGTRVANDVRAVSADHMVHAPSREFGRMNKTSVTPVLLPASSHSLLTGDHAPAQELLSMGLPVALGSDFSPSNWILGPLTVAAIAARELRMKAAQIIKAITINAARALQRDDRTGSLSQGKSADIVVLKAPSHKWIGYTYGEGLVDKVLIAGKEQVREGNRIE